MIQGFFLIFLYRNLSLPISHFSNTEQSRVTIQKPFNCWENTHGKKIHTIISNGN